jgi:hypothetical protein
MVSDDDKALVAIFFMPAPQRGDYMLAVYSTEGPHVEQDNLAAQIRQP